MVQLQEQMDGLTAAVGGLRGEWDEAADALRGDREVLR
jgi:hypothetical protein